MYIFITKIRNFPSRNYKKTKIRKTLAETKKSVFFWVCPNRETFGYCPIHPLFFVNSRLKNVILYRKHIWYISTTIHITTFTCQLLYFFFCLQIEPFLCLQLTCWHVIQIAVHTNYVYSPFPGVFRIKLSPTWYMCCVHLQEQQNWLNLSK